jgi:hypothetical protein
MPNLFAQTALGCQLLACRQLILLVVVDKYRLYGLFFGAVEFPPVA